MSDLRFGGKKFDTVKEPSKETMLFSANYDHISVLILWYFGFHVGSGGLWLTAHTIEKYLKSLLLINNQKLSQAELKKYGHNLKELWEEVKKHFDFPNKDNFQYDRFIGELRTIDIDVRYSQASIKIVDNFLYIYTILATELRFTILGVENFEKFELYGIEEKYIPDILGKGMNEARLILKRIFHLIIEHGCSPFFGAIFDYNSLKQPPPPRYLMRNEKDVDCPICKGVVKLPITRENTKIIASYYRGLE